VRISSSGPSVMVAMECACAFFSPRKVFGLPALFAAHSPAMQCPMLIRVAAALAALTYPAALGSSIAPRAVNVGRSLQSAYCAPGQACWPTQVLSPAVPPLFLFWENGERSSPPPTPTPSTAQ
jgi:hypothetical protein